MPPKGEIAGQDELFPSGEFHTGAPLRYKPLSGRLWTENKAKLIARYLREFVFVTKHGTYIDLFSGRQSEQVPDGWSVDQVLQMQPLAMRLRHYRLFELEPAKVESLESLATNYEHLDITVHGGDTNQTLATVLPMGSIGSKEATFCLVDQRTTECSWSSVEHLAALKGGEYKPEIFYFLAQSWLNRTLKTRSTEVAIQQTTEWWGRPDWMSLIDMSLPARATHLAKRFEDELGYKYATPWPIYEYKGNGRIMFHMIHATDHDRAPALMRRAYEWAVAPVVRADDEEQLKMELAGLEY
jgi:three-Cys-motif partner protein